MKLLLNKAHIDENSLYKIYLDQKKPEDLPENQLVFAGNIQEMKDFFGVTNVIQPTVTAISSLVSNDGSHITKLFEKKSKKPEALRQHEALNFPVVYRNYNEVDSYIFENDPVGSFDSAWEKIGSPDTFAIYLILAGV